MLASLAFIDCPRSRAGALDLTPPSSMLHLGRITEIQPGVFSTTLDMCTTAALPYILLPSVPYVWIVGHWPAGFEWWDVAVPLVMGGPARDLRVRDMQFDVFLERERFLELLPEFRHAGTIVLQMDRPVPDGLVYSKLRDRGRYSALQQNGWHLEFHLPVAGDYASVTTSDRSWLESMLARRELRSGDLP